MKKSWLYAAVCAVSALLAASSPTRADTTLVIAIAADPTGFDPEAVLNNTSGFIMATIYDSLTRYKTRIRRGRARARREMGHLRRRPHLHVPSAQGSDLPGRHAVQRQDLCQDLNRLLNKQSPDSIFNTGPVESMIDFTYGMSRSYRRPTTIPSTSSSSSLRRPSTTNLAMVWNGVVSPTAVTKYGKDFRNHPVAPGPFIFKEWRQGDQVSLDANPNYWGGKPKVDHSSSRNIPMPRRPSSRIKRGDVQILGDVCDADRPGDARRANIES